MFRKQALFGVLFLLTIQLYGQINNIDNLFVFYRSELIYEELVDSVKIGLFHYNEKEYSDVISLNEENKENEYNTIRFIGIVHLIQEEIKELNNYIKSSQSFCNEQALLNHVDIEINYYKNDNVVQRILVSSFIRNFIMFDQFQQISIRNKISKEFHHFISQILKRCKLWNDELEFNFTENY